MVREAEDRPGHGRLAAGTAVVQGGWPRSGCLRGLHPVGPARRPAGGAAGERDGRRTARFQPVHVENERSPWRPTWAGANPSPNRAEPRPLPRDPAARREPGAGRLSGSVPPAAAAAESLLHGGAPWYLDWLEHPDLADPYWQPYNFTEALQRVQPRAARRRLAGHLPRGDSPAVRDAAVPRDRRRADGWPVDAHPAAHRRLSCHYPRVAAVAGDAPGRHADATPS